MKGWAAIGGGLLVMAAPAQADELMVQAQVTGNPGQFFGPEQYPPAALRAGAQGRVAARLSIDASGVVTDCVITGSSGSADLDAATYRIALQRVRFKPARDDGGRAVASTYPLAVRWVLPVPTPSAAPTAGDVADVSLVAKDADPAGQVVTVALEVDERGKLAGCRVVSATGSPALAADACKRVRRSIGFQPAFQHGQAVRRTTIKRVLFHRPLPTGREGARAPMFAKEGAADGWVSSSDYPVDAIRLGKEGATAIAWEVTEKGTIANCRVTASSGFADLDQAACDAVTRRARFAPALDAEGKPVTSTQNQVIQWRTGR